MRQNKVRIIGGVWRSRLICFPEAAGLRPTGDRVRETLFNWLGQTLEGKTCLDLFAGSGALGFEALSRGARAVVMVESNPAVFRALQDNAAKLGAHDLELNCADAVKFLLQDRRSYDVIFLDPPFHRGLPEDLMPQLAARLAPDGMLYVESERELQAAAPWRLWRSGKSGQVYYGLLILQENDPSC